MTASDGGAARIWEIRALAELKSQPVPEWLSQWAYAVAGLRFNEKGALGRLAPDDRCKLLAVPHPGDDPWARLARWVATPTEQRTIHPNSTRSRREIAEREREFGSAASLNDALHYDPELPLTRLLLAGFESIPEQATFLRHYELEHLPADCGLWVKASDILSDQRQGKASMEAARKALALDGTQLAAQRALASALEANRQYSESLAAYEVVLLVDWQASRISLPPATWPLFQATPSVHALCSAKPPKNFQPPRRSSVNWAGR